MLKKVNTVNKRVFKTKVFVHIFQDSNEDVFQEKPTTSNQRFHRRPTSFYKAMNRHSYLDDKTVCLVFSTNQKV